MMWSKKEIRAYKKANGMQRSFKDIMLSNIYGEKLGKWALAFNVVVFALLMLWLIS